MPSGSTGSEEWVDACECHSDAIAALSRSHVESSANEVEVAATETLVIWYPALLTVAAVPTQNLVETGGDPDVQAPTWRRFQTPRFSMGSAALIGDLLHAWFPPFLLSQAVSRVSVSSYSVGET